MNNNYFAITCINNPELLWSNTDGWVEDENFDMFTLEETETLNLPIEGEWIRFNNIIKAF
jgi:hypothetical protein